MTLRIGLVALAALVSWGFAALTGLQWLRKRRASQALWTVGMIFFALAVSVQLVPLARGAWPPALYRLWYLSGAILNITFLGQGSAALALERQRTPKRRFTVGTPLLLLAAALVASSVVNGPLDLARLDQSTLLTGRAFASIGEAGPATPRFWTPWFNAYGTFWLIGGALVSAWRASRLSSRATRARALGTGLIAFGSLILASTSVLTNFFFAGAEEIGRLVGVSILFSGFVISSRTPERRRTPWRFRPSAANPARPVRRPAPPRSAR